MMQRWYSQWITTLIDSLFPRQCIGCGVFDQYLCKPCFAVQWSPDSQQLDSPFTSLSSVGLYKNPILQQSMELYKFHGAKDLSILFGTALAAVLRKQFNGSNSPQSNSDTTQITESHPLVLIPVPLHRRRIRERGFDQNLLLAQAVVVALSPHLPVVCVSNAVTRSRYTAHQTAVADEERHANLQSAFTVNVPMVQTFENATVVFIDDIITSGATLETVAAAVLEYVTPGQVHAATVLRSHA